MGAPLPGTILEGDCLKLMKDWKEGCVDVVITDPPYGEKTHSMARTNKVSASNPTGVAVKLVDFKCVDADYMVALSRCLCRLAKRWVIMTCDWMHCAELQKQCPELFVRIGIWTKPNPMPQITGDRPGMGWEAVAILCRPGKRAWNGGGTSAVWNIPKISGAHPTQKPLPLITKWLHLFSNPNDLILDPFCGAGTTLVAAEQMGRRWIGIELNPKFVEISKVRVATEAQQERLFETPIMKRRQGEMFK